MCLSVFSAEPKKPTNTSLSATLPMSKKVDRVVGGCGYAATTNNTISFF
jgi:hypothetical protein